MLRYCNVTSIAWYLFLYLYEVYNCRYIKIQFVFNLEAQYSILRCIAMHRIKFCVLWKLYHTLKWRYKFGSISFSLNEIMCWSCAIKEKVENVSIYMFFNVGYHKRQLLIICMTPVRDGPPTVWIFAMFIAIQILASSYGLEKLLFVLFCCFFFVFFVTVLGFCVWVFD